MWIVKLALRRPYTFIVLAILIMLLGVFAIVRTPDRHLSEHQYPGGRRHLALHGALARRDGDAPRSLQPSAPRRPPSTTSSTPSRSRSPRHRGRRSTSSSRTSTRSCRTRRSPAVSQTQLRQAPPGTTPPFILAYNASSVPILQLALSSPTLSEAKLFDLGNNIIRTALATVPGASMPYPYGGNAAPGTGRPRPGCAARPGALRQRRHQRHRHAEPDPAGRHREDRRPRVLRRTQRQPADDRGAERPAGHDPQRQRDLRARRGARARRLSAADQHRAPRRPPRRADERPEDRQRLHARHHQRDQGAAAADPRGSCLLASISTWSATSRCSCARRSAAWCARR